MSSVRLRTVAPLASLIFLAACSSDKVGSPSNGGHCSTLAETCLDRQQICVVNDGKEGCQPCPSGQYAPTADSCSPIAGTMQAKDFGTYALAANQEIDPLCQSWTLNNESELWVNAVELETSGGYHHSNWLFVPDTKYPGPDGAWPCAERGYDELSAAISGGVLFAQSTQAKRQVQKFPDGVAVRLPPHTRIIGGTHLLNTSDNTIQATLKMAIYALPASDVKVPLAAFRLTYQDLTIPPHALSDFTGACDFSSAIPNGTPGDLDMDLYYVLPHYHSLGHSFHLEYFGGAKDGEPIFDLGAFDGEAHGKPFDPPISMRGSKGFRFTCGFDNPRDKEVGWGIGDQEMCVMLGFARSEYLFDASVQKGAAAGQKNGTFEYSGDCGVIALDFARGKGAPADGGAP
jgi:hypothetical protein